jgi:hypothetical protein
MNGLNPGTTYTVYLSNPYNLDGWDVSGNYMIDVEYLGVIYPEAAVLTQSGTAITGVSLGGGPYPVFTITGGSVNGNTVRIVMTYGGYITELNGTIASDGSMSGTWADIQTGGSRTGTWTTTSGEAKPSNKGTGWPGLYTSAIPAFTFTTDDTGSGSWHVNIRNKYCVGQMASVWINVAGATMLISENFAVS